MSATSSSKLQSTFGDNSINILILMFKNGQLNLEPGFQRKSVWSRSDRQKLVQSIVSNYPLPSIFLYQRHEKSSVMYDVIDGKQRLESILMFLGVGSFRSKWFNARLDFGGDGGRDWWNWKDITKHEPEICSAFLAYRIPCVQVTGDMADINDLFVRINSTGKPLTSGEKRHARYYSSRFLKQAELLVKRNRTFLVGQKVLSTVQLERMKGVELLSELLISIQEGGIINKKIALDKAIGNASVNAHTLTKISSDFTSTLNVLKRMFPKSKTKGEFFKTTRFKNTAEFYSLFMVVWQMRVDKLILNDRRKNEAAAAMLRKLGAGVDELREQLREAKPSKANQQLYRNYLLTVQGDTDSAATRKRRAEILENILVPLFQMKDSKRAFSPEQRRIIWDREEQHCKGSDCPLKGKPLSWEDVTMDHVLAWIKRGKTSIGNAQVLCKSCNSRKGAR